MNFKLNDKTIIDFAKQIAHTDDIQQGLFFNTLGEELRVACKENHRTEMQCVYITNYLNYSGIEFLEMLGAFVKIRKQEREHNEKTLTPNK